MSTQAAAISGLNLMPGHPAILGDIAGTLERALKRRRSEADRALIEGLVAYAASVEQQMSEQRQRIAELEALSTTDELTGLPNERGFKDFLHRTLARARRHSESGVLAYFDLDGFKQINDRHGHAMGDLAIQHIGQILQSCIRTSDFAARLHGDEFVVMLVRSSCALGRKRILEISDIIRRTPLIHDGRKIELRASVGIATYDGSLDADALLSLADAEMYRQKHASLGYFSAAE